jgi:hypothetical protein
MRERSLRSISLVDEGVSLYDRERVEDVDFKPTYKSIVDIAVQIYNANHPPGYLRKFHPSHKSPAQEAPFAFTLPVGKDPHEPIKHLAKASVDSVDGLGKPAVSVDMTKATRFERATDVAIHRLQHFKKGGLLGVVFMVMRYEDSTSPAIANLLEDMTKEKFTDEPSEEEVARQVRVQRLTGVIDKLAVPTMTLMTMEPYETPPIFEDLTDPGMDPGTRLY